jgi:peptidyl-prolyl cis-trans isomerase D
MLSGIRKTTRNVVIALIMGLLVLAFLLTGTNDFFSGRPRDAVSFGDHGVSISATDVNLEFERIVRMETQRQRAQGNTRGITREDARSQGVDKMALEGMEQRAALESLGRSVGLVAAPDMIAAQLAKIEAFKSSVTNVFDQSTYLNAIQAQGWDDRRFKERLRVEIIGDQVISLATSGIHTPSSMARLFWVFGTEARVVDVAAITPQSVPVPPVPTEAEMRTYFEGVKDQAIRPEFRTFTVVRAATSDFALKAAPTDQQIEEHFKFRAPQLSTPETRSFVQMSAPNQEAAQQVATRLASGESPAVIAATLKLPAPIEQAGVPKAAIADQQLANAIYALAQPGTTPVVPGRLSFAVARVTAITPGKPAVLAAVRTQMIDELTKEGAEALLAEAGEKFDDAISGGQTLEEAAKTAGFRVESFPSVDQRGFTADRQPVTALLQAPEILQAGFSGAAADELNSASDGSFFAVRSDKVDPSRPLTFDEVKNELPAVLRNQALSRLMQERAAAVSEQANKAGSLVEAARSARIAMVLTERTVRRSDADQQALPPQVLGPLFGIPANSATPIPGPNGTTLVAFVRSISRSDPSTDTVGVAQWRERISGSLVEDAGRAAAQSAVTRLNLRRNDVLFRQAVGADAAEEPGDTTKK